MLFILYNPKQRSSKVQDLATMKSTIEYLWPTISNNGITTSVYFMTINIFRCAPELLWTSVTAPFISRSFVIIGLLAICIHSKEMRSTNLDCPFVKKAVLFSARSSWAAIHVKIVAITLKRKNHFEELHMQRIKPFWMEKFQTKTFRIKKFALFWNIGEMSIDRMIRLKWVIFV